jgi:AcrR family transcriptional regulator
MPLTDRHPATGTGPEAPQRMLEAAVEAFAERGYHATTTRDIAARAGLSPAAIYVHFPSKAALLARISLTGHEAALDLVRRASADGPAEGAAARLHRVVRAFAAWHAEHHRVARVVQYELGALPDDARRDVVTLRRAIEQAVEDVVRAGIADGTMAAAQPRRVARAILSLCVDVARWYDPAGRETPADLGELYAALALQMVAPAAAGR